MSRFLYKLYAMLEDTEHAKIIAWNENVGRSETVIPAGAHCSAGWV